MDSTCINWDAVNKRQTCMTWCTQQKQMNGRSMSPEIVLLEKQPAASWGVQPTSGNLKSVLRSASSTWQEEAISKRRASNPTASATFLWHFYRATIQFHTFWMSVWIKSFNFCFSWALAIQKRSFWPVRDSELHVIATAWLSNAVFFFFPEWQLMRSSPVLLQSKVWHCAPWYQLRDEPAITVQVMKKAFMQHNRLL